MNKKLIKLPVNKNDSPLQVSTKLVLNYNHDHNIKFNKFNKIVNYYMENHGYAGKLNDLLIYFAEEIKKGVDPYVKYKVAVSNN